MFSYNELSTEVYDLTKPVGFSINGDIEYYLEKLKGCKGRILEPFVGSGRMLIPLLQAGFTVNGIDYSPEMLASCRKRCTEQGFDPILIEGSVEQFSSPHEYEAIIIPTGSFLLIENRETSIRALKRLFDHLAPGGRLIVDLFLPASNLEIGKTSFSTYPLPSGDLITMEENCAEIDYINQYAVSYLKYEKWQKGKLIQTELQRFPLRWYGYEEFKLILANIGFSQISSAADYEDHKQPTNETSIFTFEAVK